MDRVSEFLAGNGRYVLLLFALFVLPRMLQRWRLPAAVTSLAIGAAVAIGLGWFRHDSTISLLSTLGIVALFLFAGMEIDLAELHRQRGVLTGHLVLYSLALVGLAGLVRGLFSLPTAPAVLVALALLTPSTGFILDSLASFGFEESERQAVKLKAIASELLALVVLFVTVQSSSWSQLAISGGVLVAMILLLPLAFHAFARFIAPHAPNTEFAFLLMTAAVCASITRELGVYYLVGAFVVGLVARRFGLRIAVMGSGNFIKALELFASVFIPFYFFHAGTEIRREDLGPFAWIIGLVFLVALLPPRVMLVAGLRRFASRETGRASLRIAASLLPTLVFGLVIARILREHYSVDPAIFGAVVVYTIASTVIPGFFLHAPTVEYGRPTADGGSPADERAAAENDRT